MAAANAAPDSTDLADQTDALIAGSYLVDFSAELPAAGGGQQAFAVADRRGGRTGLMAVAVRPEAPVRAHMINLLLPQAVAGVLSPVAQGAARSRGGSPGWFVICEAPPGPCLWLPPFAPIRPWSEGDLLERVLRPAAHALEQLQARHVTHRAIRPDNLFRAGPRDPVTLGAAWAAPPASLQAAIYEPPYVASCVAGGRGDGSIADDVYALGVTLLVLASGRLPLTGLNTVEVVRRKLELGSFAALAGEERLPPAIADLVRGMLAEDPEHRPPPTLLADPMAARTRRVAARPPRRAQRPLEIGQQTVWTARTLAYAMADEPDQAVRLLRGGGVDRWIRRSLGDSVLATRLEEAVRLQGAEAATENRRADSMLTMRAVAVLDPLAPLCWRGIALWPDGLGPILAGADAPGALDLSEPLQQMLEAEAFTAWGNVRPERCDPSLLRLDAHQHRTLLRLRGWGGGLPRLRYLLNPLLPCRSKMLAGRFVVRLADLLPALEDVARTNRQRHQGEGGIVDRDLAAFIAARHEARIERELIALADANKPEVAALVQLRLLAGLQAQANGRPVPALAAWLEQQVARALSVWRSRQRRERMQAALTEMSTAGRLGAMLAVLEDSATQLTDQRELQEAKARICEIDARIAAIEDGADLRQEAARRIGQEIVAGIGAVALTVAVVAACIP